MSQPNCEAAAPAEAPFNPQDTMNRSTNTPQDHARATLPSIELFAGAGGLALGSEKAGFTSRVTAEWNRWACDTMRQNKAAGHPLVEHWNVVEGDVRDHDWSQYADQVPLVTGGPPCQPFSAGGRGRAADDPRDMFPATADVIAAVRPEAFIIENVRGLTRASFADYVEYITTRMEVPEITPREGEPWSEHFERMKREEADSRATLRYRVQLHLVDAADYGVPQRRHRVFFIGLREDVTADWEFPKPTHSHLALVRDQWATGGYWNRHGIVAPSGVERPSSNLIARSQEEIPPLQPWRTVRDALAGVPEPGTRAGERLKNHHSRCGARTYPGHTGSPLDLPSKALKAGAHGVPGGENMLRRPDGTVRYYSVRESAMIQTFPDDYELHGSWGEAMRQLGNAVPVELARRVAESVHTTLIANTPGRPA